ncbi:MAG: hypothetical protein RJP96_02715 [Algiphilus sp.]|uniref:hypothetical protein n=1 Tax=Algiphilus sp. TaxID=1872431 RepID=UPI0032EF2A86
MSLWRALEYDSRPVELGTAICCVVLAVTWAADGYAAWLGWPPWMQNAGGVAAWLMAAAAHAATVVSGRHRPRQWFAMASALLFGAVAGNAFWAGDPPLCALAAVGSAAQAWAYLAIEADSVDARRRLHGGRYGEAR